MTHVRGCKMLLVAAQEWDYLRTRLRTSHASAARHIEDLGGSGIGSELVRPMCSRLAYTIVACVCGQRPNLKLRMHRTLLLPSSAARPKRSSTQSCATCTVHQSVAPDWMQHLRAPRRIRSCRVDDALLLGHVAVERLVPCQPRCSSAHLVTWLRAAPVFTSAC